MTGKSYSKDAHTYIRGILHTPHRSSFSIKFLYVLTNVNIIL